MKKIKFLCMILMFCVFVPKVYAFTYDIDLSVDDVAITEGVTKEIKVILKDVQGLDVGFATCLMNIEHDDTIIFDGSVKTFSGWNVTAGNNVYIIDTDASFKSDSQMFSIPVKINGAGSVKLSNIECSDGNTKETIQNKVISFSISSEGVSVSEDPKVDISKFNITNVILSEGSIDFNPNVSEYTVNVTSFDDLEVTVEFGDSNSSYFIDRNDINGTKSLDLTITNADGDNVIYRINVIEDGAVSSDLMENNDNNKYVPIFIGIICILVFINIFRIVKNIKK